MDDFALEPTHYVLNFDELPAKGLQITVRAGTVRERLAFDLMRFTPAADIDAAMKQENGIFEELAKRIVSWNLAAPVGVDAVLDLDEPVAKQIIGAWIDVITNGGADLGKDSTPGPNPMEASLPMESL